MTIDGIVRAYDVGFLKKPDLRVLDAFMQILGFEIEPQRERNRNFTRVYTKQVFDASPQILDNEGAHILSAEEAEQTMEFFYNENADERADFFEENAGKVVSYGSLKAVILVGPAILDTNKRIELISKNRVRTELDSFRHLNPRSLKQYETAIAIKNRFGAIVTHESTGKEINPDREIYDLEMIDKEYEKILKEREEK